MENKLNYCRLSTCLSIGAALLLCTFVRPASADSARFALAVTHVPSTIYSAKLKDTAEASRPMRLTIVLPLRNQEELESTIQKLSDPKNRSHNNFLTQQEFASQYGPTAEDRAAVCAFAGNNGLSVTHVSASGTSVEVSGTAANVEAAFNLKINDYVGSDGRTFFAPDREPTVTADIGGKVLSVLGLDNAAVVGNNLTCVGAPTAGGNSGSRAPDELLPNDNGNALRALLTDNLANAGSNLSGTGVSANGYAELSPNDIRSIYNNQRLPAHATEQV
jgi:subtilase family serine protease